MARLASADPPHESGRRWRPTPADGAALIVFLITEAQAQVAEATQAAQQATQILFEYKLLGAGCVFLLIAVGVLFWMLIRSYEKRAELATQLATIAANSTSAIASHASAIDRMQAAQATAAETLREQGAETAREIQENRHTVANHLAGVNAVMELLAKRQGAA